MSSNQRKILDMLSEGKISVEEAETLLAALESEDKSAHEDVSSEGNAKLSFKYLRVVVTPGPDSDTQDKVNIRVPLKLIRAGLKWAAFIPHDARSKVNLAMKEKGIEKDIFSLKPEDIEELVSNLDDLQVDVEGKESVRIYCE
jgi:hypothetical protein